MEFVDALEQKVRDLVVAYVGTGTDPTYVVKATDDHLRDFNITTENPFAVITCRNAEPTAQEIGSYPECKSWAVQIFILAVDKNWTTGKLARNSIANRLWKKFETNPMLGSFTFTGLDGRVDQVYGSQVESVSFDGSGEDGYYTFVTEMHLRVDTSTS